VICFRKEKAISILALLFFCKKNLKGKKSNLKLYFVIWKNSFIFKIEKNVLFFLQISEKEIFIFFLENFYLKTSPCFGKTIFPKKRTHGRTP
jgi:hypothetical protein